MSKPKKRWLDIVKLVSIMAGFWLGLFASLIWGREGDWIRFGLGLAGAIVLATFFSFVVICMKIDDGFEKLNKLFEEKQSEDDKE